MAQHIERTRFIFSWFRGEEAAKAGLGELTRARCRQQDWTVVSAKWRRCNYAGIDGLPTEAVATVTYAERE